MHIFRTRNVHEVLPEGVRELIRRGEPSKSRYGDVLTLPEPVVTVYEQPRERVIFWAQRDAHPYFHFFEALWMLAGRDDVAFVAQFVKRMATFSDNGKDFHAAYGHRWRRHWSFDQVNRLIALMKAFPQTRRAVIGIWDPLVDLKTDESFKDIPCNTQVYFGRVHDRLDMTVTCRSNDMVWGAFGANAVQFSVLQEYVAGMLGCEVGKFYQVSNNFHGYPQSLDPVRDLASEASDTLANRWVSSPYREERVSPYPMISCPSTWDRDLALFMEDPTSNGYEDQFFSRVVKPLWFSHVAYKKKDFATAYDLIGRCEATDWALAAREWLQRREEKANG